MSVLLLLSVAAVLFLKLNAGNVFENILGLGILEILFIVAYLYRRNFSKQNK